MLVLLVFCIKWGLELSISFPQIFFLGKFFSKIIKTKFSLQFPSTVNFPYFFKFLSLKNQILLKILPPMSMSNVRVADSILIFFIKWKTVILLIISYLNVRGGRLINVCVVWERHTSETKEIWARKTGNFGFVSILQEFQGNLPKSWFLWHPYKPLKLPETSISSSPIEVLYKKLCKKIQEKIKSFSLYNPYNCILTNKILIKSFHFYHLIFKF